MSLKKQFSKTKPVCKVTFNLPKEAVKGANEVAVVGEFNNWDKENGVPMKATKGGYSAVLELETGREYQFRYLIDGLKWENDWAADDYVATPYGVENSVVAVPATAKKAPAKKVTAKKTTKKVAATTPAADDLKKIEGVGPKIAGLLNDAGIITFDDLGKAKITVLREVLANAGKRYQMHDPKTWSKQAKLAAKGKWDELNALQDVLKGGK
jgi:predicted flap endonuclease-1-like 5' DNA nuclease